jgi:hypothetical protein
VRRRRDKLAPCFQDTGVEVLDYVGLYGRSDPDYVIEGDWHPTPRAYRALAEAIVRDVGLQSIPAASAAAGQQRS